MTKIGFEKAEGIVEQEKMLVTVNNIQHCFQKTFFPKFAIFGLRIKFATLGSCWVKNCHKVKSREKLVYTLEATFSVQYF